MEGYQLISYFFTNAIRVCGAFLLVAEVFQFQVNKKVTGGFLIGIAAIITAVQGFTYLQQYQLLGIELLLILAGLVWYYRQQPRMSIFLLFFYEMTVALWEFLISSSMGILFKNSSFLDPKAGEYLVAIWGVRILMLILAFAYYKVREKEIHISRPIVMFAIISFFAVITVSEQTRLPIESETTASWMFMTIILMFAILVYNLGKQYEMEKEVARLQTEQAELIRNDYQNLNMIYSANAKLYHDLHNHLEMMYCYLTQEKVKEALDYLEDLRTPIQEITQTVWTGDEAIDYLINSKLALMQKEQISVKTNIEFPRNTNIRSATLTTILGNLLDNAFEAVQKCKKEQRFVHLTIRRINNILIIKVENSFEEAPMMEGGEIQSSKKDKQRHGWGLKSARTAAESYDGSLETSFHDNVFGVVVTLFF